MKKLTLEKLLEVGKSAPVDGEFGLNACKEDIKIFLKMCKRYGEERSLYELLEIYVERAKADELFYATMIYACWQLINGN